MVGYKKLPAVFYATAGGFEPVRAWLKDLGGNDRRIVGQDIAVAEYGWPVGMPICRPLGRGLWEIRSSISGRRIARVIFSVTAQRMVLLHGFVKKAQRTPKHDLDLAIQRMKEIAR